MTDESVELKGTILSGERSISHGKLFENIGRVATGLSNFGVGPDSTIPIMLRNDIVFFAFFEASIGANVVGAYAVPSIPPNLRDQGRSRIGTGQTP